MSDSFKCRTLQEKDEEAVRRLVESTFSFLPIGKFWDWKYLRNPSFDRSFVAVAEEEGKIIGCNHWLPRKVKLADSIVVDSMLGASIAVLAEYRKKGVGRALIHFLRSQHSERKLALMYMFADPELRKHFHTPVAGYVPAPGGTVWYRKILNWNKVKTNVTDFNMRVKQGEFGDRLDKVDLTVVFKVHGAPPLCLHLDGEGFETTSSIEKADVTISSDGKLFTKIRDRQIGMRMLIGSLVTGRLRIGGSPRKMFELYKNIRAFREILSGKIT
jgi:predicted N-acetyltransferase YhbS